MRPVLVRFAVIALAGWAALTVPASSQLAELGVLDRIEPGNWEIRLRDGSQPPYPICLKNGRRLIQLRHEALNCQQLVVDGRADEVTVQYTCTGRGYGRTSIRRETGRLLQIETQGIADGLPFEFAAEARRIGDCNR